MRIRAESALRHTALFFGMMASGGNLIVPREAWVVMTILTCLTLLRWRIPLWTSRTLIYIWVVLVILLLFLLQGPDSIVSIASRTMTFLAALLLLEVYLSRPLDRLMADLFNILCLMSMQAILTSLLGNFARDLFWTINVQDLDYHTLGFLFNFHFVHEEVGRYVRPDGFFYEAGVFQIYLSIFLYLSLFWRFNAFWAAMASVALATTWSTVGLGVAVALLLIFSWQLRSRLHGRGLTLVLIGYVVLLPIVVSLAISNVDEKMSGELRGSFLAREYDFYTGVNIIEARPLTGIGFGVDRYLHYSNMFGYQATELRVEQTDERPNTNGLMQVLYTIGLPLGLPLLFGMFTQRLFGAKLPMMLILGASFYSQSVVFTPFFLSILFSGFLWSPNFRVTMQRLPE